MSWVQFKQLIITLQPTTPQRVHCQFKVQILDNLTSPSRLCRSCLRRFGDLKKHVPGFLEHVSRGFCGFLSISGPPALCICVAAACGASATSKKHAPWFLEHVFCGVCDFCTVLRSPGNCFIIWPICSNDYASKTRIKILCKKTCFMAHICFCSEPHFLCNSWETGTLARMSTGINFESPTNYIYELESIIFTPTNQRVKLTQ